ncbi:hypothetical protein MVEN_00349000 [Mycena venus]|uniref:Uncharacterized protein n=1 Tax=Mycena venus TaxID=2733690 RepID=A0A8H6YVV3_9AGAR|nr:hypothetical protein MVEN_00349000 [Mycena venus]
MSMVAGSDSSRSASLQISEIHVSSAEPTKLRVIVSVRMQLKRDKPIQLGDARSKGAERGLSIQFPHSIVDIGATLVVQVYRQHRLLSDEVLLKEEFPFQTLMEYCLGKSKSKVYAIFNQRGITIRMKLKPNSATLTLPDVESEPRLATLSRSSESRTINNYIYGGMGGSGGGGGLKISPQTMYISERLGRIGKIRRMHYSGRNARR